MYSITFQIFLCRHLELFAVPADHRIKLKESEKMDKYLDLSWELKKTMEYKGDLCIRCSN